MSTLSCTRILVSMVLAAAAPALAATPLNLSTGLNASGTLQSTSGAADANWSINALPAQVVTPASADWWGFWPANDANSVWIARDPSTSANGTGVYSRTFDLTGIDLATVLMSGKWAVDDEGTFSLNGHQIGAYQPHDGWNNFATQTFLVDNTGGWFNQGVNTLTLTIAQSDTFFEGVRLQGTLTGTAVPEPASLALLGLSGLLLLRRRTGH